MNTPIQIARFPDGGFALHKVTLPGHEGRFSAWYAANGAIIDAEHIVTIRGQAVARKVGQRTFRELGNVGACMREVSA